MNKLHTHLHLQHHRHSFKLLHHRHTSYHGLAVVFALAGLSILGLNALSRAAADSLMSVSVTVAAPVPSQPPVIGVPASNAQLHTARTTVAGDCPIIDPQVAVQIYVDGTAAGSGICDSANQFAVAVTLPPGAHELTAQSYTIDGTAAPHKSDPVQVTYASAAASNNLIRVLTSQNALSFLGAGKMASWDGTLADSEGGSLNIDWGDGTRTMQDVQPGNLHAEHHYGTRASHNIVLTYADARGKTIALQYAVAAYQSYTPAAAPASPTVKPPLSTSTAIGLYGLFLTCLAACGILWILEKHHTPELVLLHHD